MLARTPAKAHVLEENEKRRKQQKEPWASSCQFRPAQMCLSGREDSCAITRRGQAATFLGAGVVTDVGQECRSWTVRADLSCFPPGPQSDPP